MFGQTVITRFEEVKRYDERKGKCSACGKKRKRSFSVCNTVNPFNENEDGTVKTFEEVRKRVIDKLKEFLDKFDKRGFKCASCEDELFCQA